MSISGEKENEGGEDEEIRQELKRNKVPGWCLSMIAQETVEKEIMDILTIQKAIKNSFEGMDERQSMEVAWSVMSFFRIFKSCTGYPDVSGGKPGDVSAGRSWIGENKIRKGNSLRFQGMADLLLGPEHSEDQGNVKNWRKAGAEHIRIDFRGGMDHAGY